MKRKMVFVCVMLVLLSWLAGTAPAHGVGSGALDAVASAEFLGEGAGDSAGASVSVAGDVNGDGFDDFLVGAPQNDDGGAGAGAAYLVLGGPSGWSLDKSLGQAPIIQYMGETASDQAGSSVAGAGDVNADGYDDFLVGAPYSDGGGFVSGAAYLVLGSASPSGGSLSAAIRYSGETADDEAGFGVAGAGDVNGDGYDDLVVGARLNDGGGDDAGAAYLVLGSASPSGGSLSAAIQYTGVEAEDEAGHSVAGAGDVNGDGYDDFLVGARYSEVWYQQENAGRAYLILGSAVPGGGSLFDAVNYTGEENGDLASFSIAGAGDVNGDGYDDFLVGAHQNDDGGDSAGAAYLVLGSAAPISGSLSEAIQYTGVEPFELAGLGVGGAGDVNGDGYDDFLVGSLNDAGGDSAGAAYLVLGSTKPGGGSLTDEIRYEGEAANDHAGIDLVGAGDVNGDGYDDILVGAYFNDDAGDTAGAAYLLLSDGPTSGADPYRHRTRLAGGGNALPVTLEQARVRVDFTTNALSGADVAVTRHIVHPCVNSLRLQMPIWDVESAKLGAGTILDLRFEYTDGQLGDMVEANLQLYWRESGQPCSDWNLVPGSVVDAGANAVSAFGLSSLGQYTIADSLPPTTVDFSGLTGAVAPAGFAPAIFWPAAVLFLVVGSGVTILRRRQGTTFEEGYVLADQPESRRHVAANELSADELADRVAAKLAERLEP